MEVIIIFNSFLNNNCNYNCNYHNNCPKNLLYPLLYNLPLKLNIGNCHYITGKDIATFGSLVSVENYLTSLTCNTKKYIKNRLNFF